MTTRIFKIIRSHFAALTVVILSMGLSYSASAQFAASPCDPDYYKSLEARAWLEAQREITQNQNLIFKPDSVLEYTCFDKNLGELAQNAQNMFSESQRWGEIVPVGSMETALNNLVGASLRDYDQANFNHNLLGGRGAEAYTPAAITQEDYGCQIMQQVWQEAKCMNFIDENNDGFFTFAEYASDDKRKFPSPCGNTPLWNTNIQQVSAGSTTWTADDTKTYLDDIFRSSCGGSDSRFNIKTGLLVTRAKGVGGNNVTDYLERVCVVPGCYWSPTSMSGGSCKSAREDFANSLPSGF